MGERREIRTDRDAHDLAETLIARMGEGWTVEFNRLSRTRLQNNSLHRWLDELSKRLNHAGFGVSGLLSAILKSGADIPWSTTTAKDILYRPVMKAITDKESTKELDTVEPSEICLIVGQKVSEATGITAPPWPDRFNGGGREQ